MCSSRMLVVSGAVIMALSRLASAQFPGDVYFAEPSIAVEQGQTASLDVQLFAGTAAVGAVQFDLEFNSSEFEIVRVDPGSRTELQRAMTFSISGGLVRVIAMNDQSVRGPIGTVGVFRLTVKPLVSAGRTVRMTIRSRAFLDTSGGTHPTRGFSVSVAVISPRGVAVRSNDASTASKQGEASAPQQAEADSLAPLLGRSEQIRQVVLPTPSDSGGFEATRVQVRQKHSREASPSSKSRE